MEYILELKPNNQLNLPTELVNLAALKPGSHFEAHLEADRLIITQLPFSSTEQAQKLDQTVTELQTQGRAIE